MTATCSLPQRTANDDKSTTIPQEMPCHRPSIRIRSYQPCDHQQVVNLFVAGLMIYANMPGQSYKLWDDYVVASLEDDMANIEATYCATGGNYFVAVAEKDDGSQEIAGMVALENQGHGQGELRRMSVKAEYRRFGVGRMLVQALESWAADHAYTRVHLCVGYTMEKAQQFYKSLGFTIFEDKLVSQDPYYLEACMEKKLTPIESNQ